GIKLAKWWAGEARRVYAVLDDMAGDTATAALVSFIRGNSNRVTPRDVHRWNAIRYPTTDDAFVAISKLANRGRWVAEQTGGRPSVYFTLNSTPDGAK